MHFTYQESCDAVGYSCTAYLAAPKLEYKLIAYLNGNVIECEDEQTWFKFKLKEKNVTKESKLIYEKFWEELKLLEGLAIGHFYAKLVEYFSELSPAQFALCYSKAYDYSHSDGYNSVAEKMEEYVQLCQEFVLAEGKE